MSTTEVASHCVNDADDQDALDRSTDYAQSQGLGVVFIPGLDVEGKECCDNSQSAEIPRYVLKLFALAEASRINCTA